MFVVGHYRRERAKFALSLCELWHHASSRQPELISLITRKATPGGSRSIHSSLTGQRRLCILLGPDAGRAVLPRYSDWSVTVSPARRRRWQPCSWSGCGCSRGVGAIEANPASRHVGPAQRVLNMGSSRVTLYLLQCAVATD